VSQERWEKRVGLADMHGTVVQMTFDVEGEVIQS
jgi:hypothetical protein